MATTDDKLLIQAIVNNYTEDFVPCPISSSTSSSDSSDSEGFLIIKRTKITNFMATVDAYSDEEFKKHFRLSRETTALLIDLYASSEICPHQIHGGHPKVGAKKEIHVFLWYVANTITYRQMGNLFGFADSTIFTVLNRVSSWLVSVSHEYIVWPHSIQSIQRATTAFEVMGRIPGVLGAIDGSHIKIKKPSVNQELYFNRKGFHSVVLQAVVDSTKRFIDVYCGEPGSMHDARVLRRSQLFRLASQNEVFKNNSFLLGDSAYPSNLWLVPPFKDTGNLSQRQKHYNRIHSSSRIVVENAFGLMKCRFRRILHFTEHIDLGTVKNIVGACCVLHNICLNSNDNLDVPDSSDEQLDAMVPDAEESGENRQVERRHVDRRQQLINELVSKNILS